MNSNFLPQYYSIFSKTVGPLYKFSHVYNIKIENFIYASCV